MLPSYHFSYLVGVLIFWVAWVACSIFGKTYRAEIRWGTLIAAPLALTSLLFVPQYWTPPALFRQRIKDGIAKATDGLLCIFAPADSQSEDRLARLESSHVQRRCDSLKQNIEDIDGLIRREYSS